MQRDLTDAARRRRRMVPDALTLLRPVLGVAAGLAAALGQAGVGGWLYLAGYCTDVLDGFAARALGVASDAGTRLDGWADLVSMYAMGLGLVVGGARASTWWVVVVVIAAAVGGHAVDRWMLAAHTGIGKALGGLTRGGLLLLFVALAPTGQRVGLLVGGAVLLVPTFAYEAVVTRAELRSGERQLR